MKDILIKKKQELEQELAQQVINEADVNEIETMVKEYKDNLVQAKEEEYKENKATIEAQLELIDDLMDELEEEAEAASYDEQIATSGINQL